MSAQGSSRMGESSRGPEKGEAYGVASVTNVMKGVDFPVSKQDLIQRFGQRDIHWTKESRPIRLEELLRQVPRDQFNSVVEITAAISDIAEKKGVSR